MMVLMPHIPFNNFSVMSGRVFLGRTSTMQRINFLLKDSGKLDSTTSRSRVKHYTNEPLRSLYQVCTCNNVISAGYCMVCASVREDIPRALASGLSPVSTHKPYNNFLLNQHAFANCDISDVTYWTICKRCLCNNLLKYF